MIQDEKSGALKPFNFDLIYNHIPGLRKLQHKLNFFSFDPLIDSSNMNPKFWTKLATVIEDNYEDYDGFVVLHGSDTMAYSASVLSFMLENLNKAVIFTGSQLPLGVLRTDGTENFVSAIEIAAMKEDDTPIIPEVAIYFESKLYRGNRTHKSNAENFEAFVSGNYPVLADVGVHIKYRKNYIAKPNFKKLRVHKNLDTNIVVLKLFPGISETVVNSILNTPNLKAVIMETYGSGNAPTDKWFIDRLENAIKKGIIILNVSQCKGGSVQIGKYETSVDMGRIGVIGGYDITTEAAIAKLMYLLGENYSNEKVKQLLQTSLRGEITIEVEETQ